jgi:ribosome recycling factor
MISRDLKKRVTRQVHNFFSETWVNHFRNLHSNIDNLFSNRINELENILKGKEKKAIYNDLDFGNNKCTVKA